MPFSRLFTFRGLSLLLVLAVALAFTGCASTKPPIRSVRVAVLDGRTNFEVPQKAEIQDVGWWFGARDRYLSPNLGVILAEALSTQLAKVKGVEVHPREDLQIYMAQKERVLKRNYPQLDSAARKKLLLQQDPIDYGKSLNADYVITSDIIVAKTVTNRTFSFWYSTIDVIVQVYDVSTGELIWTRPWSDTDILRSQMAIAQECAKDTTRRIKRKDVLLLTVPR
ncbi:hypothetical protein IT570_00130 [Candidatus Sumerlaeota bacterium]|nr:hypothetical protein [Candidatus Sumerlaeota bacterium]